MRNTLKDLNNHLFAQLERLSDESYSNEELSVEFERADAISKVASQIIQNGALVLKAKQICYDTGTGEVPRMLEGE